MGIADGETQVVAVLEDGEDVRGDEGRALGPRVMPLTPRLSRVRSTATALCSNRLTTRVNPASRRS
jgi:hypothetical protein